MAILKIKKLIEDLERNQSQVLGTVTKSMSGIDAGTSAYALSSVYAASAGSAYYAQLAGTAVYAESGSSGTSGTSGTGGTSGTSGSSGE